MVYFLVSKIQIFTFINSHVPLVLFVLKMVEAIPELTSPCSVHEVMELKDFFDGAPEASIEMMNSTETSDNESMESLSRFVCVTDFSGNLKYSNLKVLKKFDNILSRLRISSQEVFDKITQLKMRQPEFAPETTTLLNGLISFISFDAMRIPTLLKLQNHDQFLIWTFKKASIAEVQQDQTTAFKIDENWYKFTKFKTVLAIDNFGNLLNYPRELLKYLIKADLTNLTNLNEIIQVPDELNKILKTFSDQDHQIDHYQKFSASSLDLLVDNFPRPIYSAVTSLLTGGMSVEVNLYSPLTSINNGKIFPLQLKYSESEDAAQTHKSMDEQVQFPEFSGFKITRKLSESLHSSVYEAVRLFKTNELVIIKVIHGDKLNEIKFYNFFCNDQVRCDFIEKPFKIEANSQKPAIFMNYLHNRCDLFEFIHRNDFMPVDTIKTIFIQIVKAVDFLHTNGIIHRDIKVIGYIKTILLITHCIL